MFYSQGRNQRAVWKYLRQTSTLCRVFLVLGEVSPCFGNICYEAAQALRSNRWSVWSGNSEPRCCRCASMIWRQQKVWIALSPAPEDWLRQYILCCCTKSHHCHRCPTGWRPSESSSDHQVFMGMSTNGWCNRDGVCSEAENLRRQADIGDSNVRWIRLAKYAHSHHTR